MIADRLELAPARWIWLPCQRTLQNTMVLFRHEFSLDDLPCSAIGWIVADSRYRLTVNGQRVQWGPAASDPRSQEADPLDLTGLLRVGRNVLAIEVLFYGTGDGTWPAGSPGLLLRLDLHGTDGSRRAVISDGSWRCQVDRAWMPGRYKRWYLRALQEIVDSRRHPVGWQTAGFDDGDWYHAAELPGRADQPALVAGARDYLYDAGWESGSSPVPLTLRPRCIPLLDDAVQIDADLVEAGTVHWRRDPDDWFEFRVEDSLEARRGPVPARGPDGWLVPATTAHEGRFLTFALPVQSLGWPQIEIEAPAGTIIELITQEGHDPVQGPAWLETAHHCWSRLICHGGQQVFETFDFESFRWLQLHIRSPDGPVVVRRCGLRRRRYPWPQEPSLRCAEPALDRLFRAAINTLHNSAHDLVVDGCGRERQQYSGDGGHQLIAIRHLFGDTALAARFLRTWSEGLTIDGYFLDCWPAYDRLNRITQRQLGLTKWGPILDHGIGFVFDHYRHWMETGDLEASREAWPRLVRQLAYIEALVGDDGLLPVEGLGVPTVWMDHIGFQRQRHKRCAFNLYAIAMLRDSMAPLARAFADAPIAARAESLATRLHRATLAAFWDSDLRLFVDNRPWQAEEGGPRTHDRTLATAVLHHLAPDDDASAMVDELAAMPDRCGWSYPANAGWRLHALAQAGRSDVVVGDLRTRWAGMASVLGNTTLQEDWVAHPDSGQEWSHCPLGAFNALIQDVIGLRPTSPGFATWQLKPRLADLADVELDAHTVGGCFRIRTLRSDNGRLLEVRIPAGVGPGEVIGLDDGRQRAAPGTVMRMLC
jgi:hypothetical protein